jgi:nicotinate-nucleotide adenylyltransferase
MRKAKKKKSGNSAVPARRKRKAKPAPRRAVKQKRRATRARSAKTAARRTAFVTRYVMPPTSPGMKIGLFGGTFNPPHEAHRAASMLAMKKLGLDRVWWLVTPGNPLKENSRLPPLKARIEAARKVAASPRIDVTGIEAELGTQFTYDTVKRLRQRRPGTEFVFIVGADNLAHLHRWERWSDLLHKITLAVVDRPEFELSSLASPAAVAFSRFRVTESKARTIPRLAPPAWVFLRGLKSELSSTALRKMRTAKRKKG